MLCPKCGSENAETSRFCCSCGAALSAGERPATSPTVQRLPQQISQVQPFSPEFFKNLGIWGQATGVGGIVGVISTILPWFTFSLGIFASSLPSLSVSGFDFTEGVLFFLGMIAVVVLCFISGLTKPVNPAIVYGLVGCSGFSALMILVLLIRIKFTLTGVSIGFILAILSGASVVVSSIARMSPTLKK